MFSVKTLRHLSHPFGRLRLITRFIRLSALQQLLWLFSVVFILNVAILAGGIGVLTLVQ